MATLASGTRSVAGQTRFFTIMAWAMALVIVAGFVLNLAAGRSSFRVPAAYHVHAVIFMGWVGLYVAQATTISAGAIRLHAALGRLAYGWVPAMVAAGSAVMIVVARRTGGPFFFNQSEFLISNLATLWCFGGLAFWALRRQRYNGWHRRLMLCAMAILTGPGIGRLLPMPLLIPNAWLICIVLTWAFPAIGMIADRRRIGHVHPAYLWGLGIQVAVFAASMLIAYSPLGYAVTRWVVDGTPGAQRPLEAFLPPGFAM
ncbi:hypothetical protein [Aurantiacibacter spongiae]|uniref:DUF2306 domain-containing protein n=1 Tax=Aurantiacibacter spongiae TaxID=2488860 RepID=A0A3N5CYZ1_9SPHN|nr:hypothetical protein [Aurantiacibacter spongiae]RPF71919.1 hypothetical protein EG799_10035 [Aurantiacibacter spongiae]